MKMKNYQQWLDIKLVVCSYTSWLTDGPAGYAEALQVIYD